MNKTGNNTKYGLTFMMKIVV